MQLISKTGFPGKPVLEISCNDYARGSTCGAHDGLHKYVLLVYVLVGRNSLRRDTKVSAGATGSSSCRSRTSCTILQSFFMAQHSNQLQDYPCCLNSTRQIVLGPSPCSSLPPVTPGLIWHLWLTSAPLTLYLFVTQVHRRNCCYACSWAANRGSATSGHVPWEPGLRVGTSGGRREQDKPLTQHGQRPQYLTRDMP